MVGASAICSRHPLREAVGVCVRCEQAFCSDCVTKLDGINHCQACLTKLGQTEAARSAKHGLRLPDWLVLPSSFLLLSALVWLMVEVLMPGSGRW